MAWKLNRLVVAAFNRCDRWSVSRVDLKALDDESVLKVPRMLRKPNVRFGRFFDGVSGFNHTLNKLATLKIDTD